MGAKAALLVITAIGLAGCFDDQGPGQAVKAKPAVDMTKYQPTAKEIFELRSACADLGQKILDDDVHSPELYVEQVSHYNPSTNRCYVEVTSSYSGKEIRRYLYDGQTKEMLASTTWKGWGNRGGMVFDKQHPYSPPRADDGGYDDADNYINTMMADDRSR